MYFPVVRAGDWAAVDRNFSLIEGALFGPDAAPTFDTFTLTGLTASRIVASDANKALESVTDFTSWIAGTANRVTVADDGDGTVTLSGPQDIHTGASPVFAGETLTGNLIMQDSSETQYWDTGNSNYVGFKAPALTANQIWALPATDGGTAGDIIKTDASGNLDFVTPTVDIPVALSMYDAEPARGSETNVHGGILSLAAGQPLDTIPTNIVVSKGIGKIVVVVNAGGDISGEITVTGTSVDRETGATTGADTDTLTIDALTTDGSDVDSNGNARHSFTGAYITSKWFTGSVTLSTVDLTLTDVDVYHVSFEQFNDSPGLTIETFDANIFTTNVAAEFDAYLYALEVTGDKCNISRLASINVGAGGETAIANRYWRLRRGNLAKALDGTVDGVWADVHYSNSPVYVEDVTLKVWASQSKALTLT